MAAVRFLWLATRGYRMAPWRSPYLRWRIETYWGIPAERLGPTEVLGFVWRHRRELVRYLRWVGHAAG